MKRHGRVSYLAGIALSLLGAVAFADDTDIYTNPGSILPSSSAPMVIFSLDYRPNLGSTVCSGTECDGLIAEGYLPPTGPYTFFDLLRAALKKVMDPIQGIRVGLMLNHNNNNNCVGPTATGCSNGGYIAMGVQPFVLNDTNGAKAKFYGTLAAIPTPQGSTSHPYQGKELFYELFRYLTGQGVYNSHNGWTDYATDNTQNLDVDGPGYSWDTSIESGSKYQSPLATASECTRIFTVNTMFFVANQDSDSDTAIQASKNQGGLATTLKDFPSMVQQLNDIDLADGTYGAAPDIPGKQNVISYFLVPPDKINTTTIDYARAGGTGAPLALSTNPDELVNTLEEVLKQVLSVSTTFVAASVPVNVFNRAQLLGSVYIALFQVDQNQKPEWAGNLKKLRLDSTTSLLVDALNQPAIASDGRIRFDALTYWTLPGLLPPPDATAGEVAGKDGRSVPRGGAGQVIPGFLSGSPGLANTDVGARQLFYDSNGALAPLNADSTTASALQSDLGAADPAEALALLKFARGLDVDDLDHDGNTSEARSWIFDDPLHSRPLALNYGARDGYSLSNPEVFLAVGSNEGYMRFIRNTTASGAESGVEAWAFMPRSTMQAQKVLRADAVGSAHPYTVDGAPAAYIEDLNNDGTIEPGDKAYLFFGLRRGGKAYYALDVSDPNNPQLLWTIQKSGDFAELGYTFSTPRVGLVDIGNGPQPVVVFGGGYDKNKDTRGSVGTDDSEGTAIYVVDAKTGALIWKARGGSAPPSAQVFEHPDLVDSIPSTVTVADTNGDVLIDRVLVGDTGGNLWRADLAGTDTSKWKLTRLAALGRHAEGTKINDRRFFHRPDIVPTQDTQGIYDAVLIGSGDRADPLDIGGLVDNYFYMIKDRNTAVGAGTDLNLVPSDLGDVTNDCLQTTTGCTVDLTKGWKLQLEGTGEKSLSTPVTISGDVFFTTYVPPGSLSGGSCSPAEGSGELYAVSLKDARSVINYDTSTDDPNQPGVATTKSDRSTTLNVPGIPAEVVSVPPNEILRPDLQIDQLNVTTRWRTFWYTREDSDL